VLQDTRASLQYPVARAARALQLASSPKDQYEALLDTAEALTITLGITAAGLFRALQLGGQELSGLQAAYVNRGVAQGVWHDVINRLRRYAASNPDVLPGAHDALVDAGLEDPGIATDLATLLQERNRAAHGSRPRDRHEAAARIAELSIPLERALVKARFLVGTTWILTESSSYQPRTQDFKVSALHLMGDHPEFEHHAFTTPDPLPDNACFALGPNGPFELSPFVVVRYCEFCRQEEIFHADRVQQTKGTSLKSFGRGHVVFDREISDELRQLI